MHRGPKVYPKRREGGWGRNEAWVVPLMQRCQDEFGKYSHSERMRIAAGLLRSSELRARALKRACDACPYNMLAWEDLCAHLAGRNAGGSRNSGGSASGGREISRDARAGAAEAGGIPAVCAGGGAEGRDVDRLHELHRGVGSQVGSAERRGARCRRRSRRVAACDGLGGE